jgi:hypothetical protein
LITKVSIFNSTYHLIREEEFVLILFGVSNIELFLAQLLYYYNWELPNELTKENLEMTKALSN